MLLPLSGCLNQEPRRPGLVRFDIPGPVVNLDPQFAYEPAARMIIRNVFEGLMAHGAGGTLELGAAAGYEVSPDNRTYTFKLRQDSFWQDGTPVTAQDFVFAFRRLFQAGASSPGAEDYLMIENAAQVMSGAKSPEALGVAAQNPRTLVFRLARPNPFFLYLLAEPAAMPCNEGFFANSRGRYGIDLRFVDSNGPLRVERWDSETGIALRQNESYKSARAFETGGVNLQISEEPAFARLEAGEADAAIVSFAEAERLAESEYAANAVETAVWCVAFNQNSPTWGNPLLRQGLALALDREMLRPALPPSFSLTDTFLPETATLAGESRGQGPAASSAGFDPEQARRLYGLGRESLPEGELTDIVLYAPDSAEHMLAAGMAQQSWQMYLNAFLTLVPQTGEQLQARLDAGDYGLILAPFRIETPRAEQILRAFASNARENILSYHNTIYDARLEALGLAQTLEEAFAACASAETILLQDAVIIPLYRESEAFVTAPGVTGAHPAASLSQTSFRTMVKE
jgi:oligopeptide transport system substrate-binding protein